MAVLIFLLPHWYLSLFGQTFYLYPMHHANSDTEKDPHTPHFFDKIGIIKRIPLKY